MLLRRPSRFWLEWLAVFLACAGICAWFQFQTPFLPEEDGYFHIKTAWLMRRQGLFLQGFPWAWFSLWREGYSDGCLLFHLFLIPFTFGDLAFGAKLATVLLSAFTFSSFFAILTLNEVRGRFYWFWLLLLGGGFFWWRMLMPRPQVLSVALLLWSFHFLLNGRVRAFAALSFLYPLSYVAAFLPQVFAVLRWGYLKAVERRSEGRIVLAGLAAYAAATLAHPYFPKNLEFAYVQNLYVMMLALTQRVNLYLGGEFFPLDTRQLAAAHAPLLAHLGGLLFVFAHRRTPLSERTRVSALAAAVAVLMAFGSKRFVEYAVPLLTLFCAFLFTDLCEGRGAWGLWRGLGRGGRALALCGLAAMAASTVVGAAIVKDEFARIRPPRFEALARTLAEKAPAGELIYTCDWDEPPELLFYNEQHRYPVLMDPTFMYYWDPEVWQRWFDVANGRLSAERTHRTLRETFGARFGVCGSEFGALRGLLGASKGFRILAEDAEGFVFEVLPPKSPPGSAVPAAEKRRPA